MRWKSAFSRVRRRFSGLRVKVLLFSAIFIAVIIAVGVFAAMTVYLQNERLHDTLLASQERADKASDSQKFLIDMERAQSQLIAELETSQIRAASRNAIKALSLMDENIQNLESVLVDNPKVKKLGLLLAETRPALMEVISAARKNDDADALNKTRAMSDVLGLIEALSSEIVQDERTRLLTTMDDQAAEGVKTIQYMGIAIAVFALMALAFSLFAASFIVSPIKQAAEVAKSVSEGDLTQVVSSSGVDETGVLLESIGVMIRNLRGLIAQVKGSSVQLVSTSTQVSYASQKQEEVSANFGASINQIAASVNEITATAQELLKTMDTVSDATDETAGVADQGKHDLAQMEQTMQALVGATASITEKLEDISARANSIGSSVVAREIRRLADQTAVATLDIERIVSDMQSSVNGGVMEMDRFGKQVREGVQESVRVSEQLSTIIESVGSLKPRFEMVHEGMQSQAYGARQIGDAMVQLKSVTQISEESSQSLKIASTQLLQEVEALKVEIARFKIS